MSAAAEKERIRVNAANRQKRQDGREIGDLPPVADWDRRNSCESSLVQFFDTYLPHAFPKNFSPKHLEAISRIQNCILLGERALLPLPRGFGKSTICVGATIWGALYGHRKFFPIITAGDGSAESRIKTIKSLLELSPVLAEDFPEVCVPIRMIGGIPQRAGGLLYNGTETRMSWKTFEIVLPSIPELDPGRQQCRASGCVIMACGITSKRIRGLQRILYDGTIVRPDFVLIDDPQDDESAHNPSQVKKLLDIFHSSIMGLAGHDKAMAVAIACNILADDDMIERLLDPATPNAFEGERVPLIAKFPDALDTLWEEYRQLLNHYDKSVLGDVNRARREATAYYLANRAEMDSGALVTWEDNFDDQSISAIQYAMTKYYTTPPEAFFAEYQNQPLKLLHDDTQLTIEQIQEKVQKGYPQGIVPAEMQCLTAFVDIQQSCLFWLVAAWGDGFSGHVVDYGVFPEQNRRYFTLRKLGKTLSKTYPGRGQEALWRVGLDDLTDKLLSREWERVDGAVMRIDQLFADANDGNALDVVIEFCRNSRHPSVVMPYTAKGVQPSDKPFSEYQKKSGDTVGFNWRVPRATTARSIRKIVADVNFWKSFVRERLRTAVGDPGGITIFQGDNDRHRLFCEHMTSEYSVRTEGRGRTVDVWKPRPNSPENHWWDCLVGAAVAASVRGIALAESGGPVLKNQVRVASREEMAAMGWGA